MNKGKAVPKSPKKTKSTLRPKVVRPSSLPQTVLTDSVESEPEESFSPLLPPLKNRPDVESQLPPLQLSEADLSFTPVGHAPTGEAGRTDVERFQVYQSNFLSMISHELRTPLMVLQNALNLMAEPELPAGMTLKELVDMARSNSYRLQQALSTLLDLAALESGTFHGKLKEVDLQRLVQARVELWASNPRHCLVNLHQEGNAASLRESFTPVMADAKKMGRAIDVCLDLAAARIKNGKSIEVRVFPIKVEFEFDLSDEANKKWRTEWVQALAGFESGLASPGSAFGAVFQSERSFLSRMEEGFGSEQLLVHQIQKLHHGKFTERQHGSVVILTLELADFSAEERLKAVLLSRAFVVSHELGSTAIALIRAPESGGGARSFSFELKNYLFRATDAVYPLPEQGLVALVMDDCKQEDTLRVVERLQKKLNRQFDFGVAHCPADGLAPEQLFKIAMDRLNRPPKK